jgi:hypothetical protein
MRLSAVLSRLYTGIIKYSAEVSNRKLAFDMSVLPQFGKWECIAAAEGCAGM